MNDQKLRQAIQEFEQAISIDAGNWTHNECLEFLEQFATSVRPLLATHPVDPAQQVEISDETVMAAARTLDGLITQMIDASRAALEAAYPLLGTRPTSEQIDEVLQLHGVGPAFRPPDPDRPNALANYRRKLRNALLELLVAVYAVRPQPTREQIRKALNKAYAAGQERGSATHASISPLSEVAKLDRLEAALFSSDQQSTSEPQGDER